MDQAWVVAVDTEYGHQRAAYPFRDIACERIITANTDACVSADERKLWRTFQDASEGVSRSQRVPVPESGPGPAGPDNAPYVQRAGTLARRDPANAPYDDVCCRMGSLPQPAGSSRQAPDAVAA